MLSRFVSTFNKWARYVEDTQENEQHLTLLFGFLAYTEVFYARSSNYLRLIKLKANSIFDTLVTDAANWRISALRNYCMGPRNRRISWIVSQFSNLRADWARLSAHRIW